MELGGKSTGLACVRTRVPPLKLEGKKEKEMTPDIQGHRAGPEEGSQGGIWEEMTLGQRQGESQGGKCFLIWGQEGEV